MKVKLSKTLLLEEIDKGSYSIVLRRIDNEYYTYSDLLVKKIHSDEYDVLFKCNCCNKWKHELLNRNELFDLLEN